MLKNEKKSLPLKIICQILEAFNLLNNSGSFLDIKKGLFLEAFILFLFLFFNKCRLSGEKKRRIKRILRRFNE